MTEQLPFDPFSFWRNLLAQAEKGVSQHAKENMRSEEFARMIAQVSDASVAGKKMTQTLMKKYLELFDLPSRSDVQALDEKLQVIQDQLADLSRVLSQLGAVTPAATPAGIVPTRTRQPPSAGGPQASTESSPAASANRYGAQSEEPNK